MLSIPVEDIPRILKRSAIPVFIGAVTGLLPILGAIPGGDRWETVFLMALGGAAGAEVIRTKLIPVLTQAVVKISDWFRRRNLTAELAKIDDYESTALRLALGRPTPSATPELDTPKWEPVLSRLKSKGIVDSYGHNTHSQARYSVEVAPDVEEYIEANAFLISPSRCVSSDDLEEYYEKRTWMEGV